MSWWHNRYPARPASKNKAARIAWDLLTQQAAEMVPPRQIAKLWLDDSQDDGYWCAELSGFDADGSKGYIDVDGLVIRDRKNNPHKYQQIAANAAVAG